MPSDQPQDEIELEDEERRGLERDLNDVDLLKEILGEQGIKGATFYCTVCGHEHHLSWDLLGGNIKRLLDEGEAWIHEPAFEPDPDDYVSWEYAQGLLDGYQSYVQREEIARTMKVVVEVREAATEPSG